MCVKLFSNIQERRKHSFFVVADGSGNEFTLSFNGQDGPSTLSKGAWLIDSDTDTKSYNEYSKRGSVKNGWDVEDTTPEAGYNVKETALEETRVSN